MGLNGIALILKRFNKHDLLKTGSAMLFVRAANIFTGIGLAIVLARGLGAESYGRYIFVLTLVYILSLPILMGLPTLLMRQVAIYRGRSDWPLLIGIFRWSLFFISATLCGIAFIMVGYYYLWPNASVIFADMSGIYLLAFLLAGVLGLMQIFSAMLRGFEKVFWGSLPDGFIRPILLFSLVFCISFFIDLSPALVMGFHVIAAFSALIWAMIMVGRYCLNEQPDHMKSPPEIQGKVWLSSLWPLSVIAGAAIINRKLDLLMLGVLSSEINVGIYSVGLQIASITLIGQTIVNAIIGPKIARMYANGDKRELQHLITYACRLSSFAAISCLIFILPFGLVLIESVFGSGFVLSYNVVLITCTGFVFSAMMGPIALVLNMTGHERITARVVVFSAFVNAILNGILIPMYGVNGAAIATLITVILIQSFLSYYAYTKTGLRTDVLAGKRR